MKKFEFKKYFLLFIIYSMIGYILEILLAMLTLHKFVNRGVLIGPYLPIYGVGCMFIILLLGNLKDKPELLVISSMLICSVLEYATSYILEVAFKTRWWDYSNNLINLNGRICLSTTVLFGILGALIIYVINPFFISLLDKLSTGTINTLFYVLIATFILDIIISFTSVINLRNSFGNNVKDTTEYVSEQAIKFIKDMFTKIKEAIV